MNNHFRHSPSNDNHRVAQWVTRQIRLQHRITRQAEDDQVAIAATGTSSESWYQSSVGQAPPVNETFEDNIFMTTVRGAPPTQRSAFHSPAGERNMWDTPCAPLLRTIPLPPVAEELEDISLMSTIANASRPIRGLIYQHSNDRPQPWEYPPTPMMRPIALPPVGDALPTPTTSHSPQVRDSGQHWHLNHALRYHDSICAVVKPVLSDMLPYPGHRWGARDQDGNSPGELNVHFAYSAVPATDPPLTRVRLAKPFGGHLVVTPTIGNQYVSVGDIQKTVTAWMRWEEPHFQYEGIRVTGKKTARARDGTTMSVEVWVWKGLTKARGGTDLWEIHL